MFIPIGIAGLFAANHLVKGKTWARKFVIGLSVLGVLSGIFNPLKYFVTIILSGAIGGYLIFSNQSKKFFGLEKENQQATPQQPAHNID